MNLGKILLQGNVKPSSSQVRQNRWGLILILVIMRAPKLAGESESIWINLLPLVPFWYLILRNELKIKPALRKSSPLLKLMIKVFLGLDLVGLLLIFYIIFFYAFREEANNLMVLLGVLMMAGLVAGLMAFIYRSREQAKKREVHLLLMAGGIHFLLLLAAIFRTSLLSPVYFVHFLQLITVIAFGLSAKSLMNKADQKKLFMESIPLALGVYVGLNLILYVLGLNNLTPNYEREYQAVVLSFLGIQTHRVYFPLAEGINAFGMVSGLCVTLNGVMVWDQITSTGVKPGRALSALFGLLAGIVCILLTDSRSALLFSAAAMIIILAVKQKHLGWVVAGLLGLQIITAVAAPHLDQLLPSGSALARKNTDLLSGRPFIWEQAHEHLIPFKPEHLIGYGFYGQTISGVVKTYSHLFESYRNQFQISLHHFLLQTVFDTGYVGAAAALFFFAAFGIRVSSLKLGAVKKQRWKLQGGLLIYLILMGTVSVVPSVYAQEIFTMMVLAWAGLTSPGAGAA
jgi:hypothetical protein